MKKLISLIIPLIFLTGCRYKLISQQELDEMLKTERGAIQTKVDLEQKKFIFDKNKDCINAKSKLDVAKYDAFGNEITIDSTFYSSTTNSCLYTTLTYIESGKDLLKRRALFDSTSAWKTQTPIIVCNETAWGTAEEEGNKYRIEEFPCDEFDKKIAEYKKFK